MRTRTWLSVVLVFVLLFPTVAIGAPPRTEKASATVAGAKKAAAQPTAILNGDDDIPGVPLTASPVAGSLDPLGGDASDVYQVVLDAGHAFIAEMTGPAGADYDLYLYAPNAASIFDGNFVASSTGEDSTERLTYTPWTSGTYYLSVEAYSGSGDYTLTWQMPTPGPDDDAPGVPIPASPVLRTLDAGTDAVDVYAVDLTENGRLSLGLTGPGDADFDLEVYGPGVPSIWTGIDYLIEGSYGDAAEESLGIQVSEAGTYYVVVIAFIGSGDYTLTWSSSVGGADDEIPGIPLTTPPVEGSLDSVTDEWDVYAVDLIAGDVLDVEMTGDPGVDFDIELYAPGVTSVMADDFTDFLLVGSYMGETSSEAFSHQAEQTGTYYVFVYAYEGAGDYSITWSIGEPSDIDVTPVAGANRIETAIKASELAFPAGSEYVVIATARNWPDALGGSALAGALYAPVLLTEPGSLSPAVVAEIDRLNATSAVILGGTGAVSQTVENSLVALLGDDYVDRVAGNNRYETAYEVASATIDIIWDVWDGTAFVATGVDFPDALGASPLAAYNGWPIYLDSPLAGSDAGLVDRMAADGVTNVIILGGTGAVPGALETALKNEFDAVDVLRIAGANRYDTAVKVAEYGVASAGLEWDGVAVATGQDFPDALAGGVLQGMTGSVLLLTHTAYLDTVVGTALGAHAEEITEVRFLGGTGAVSTATRNQVLGALD